MPDTPESFRPLAADAAFVPWHEVAGRPHVCVDGPELPHTVLGLSHWPDGGAPEALAADTSAEIVTRYLGAPHDGEPVGVVTNNHFDEDGLIAAWMLLERPSHDLWPAAIAAAEAGDFKTWRDPSAAWSALAMMAAAERATTPFSDVMRALNRAGGHDPAGAITVTLLAHVESMLCEPQRYRRLWEPAWRRIEADMAVLDRRPDRITEIPGGDLAIVRCDRMLDPLAVMPRLTSSMRVLWALDGGWYRLEHRYETWVRYVSRPLPPRRDLAPLIPRLSAVEPAAGRWTFEGAHTPAGRLAFVDDRGAPAPSALDLDLLVDLIASPAEVPA